MGQLSREQKTAATDLQAMICQFRRCSASTSLDSTDKATQRQTLAFYGDIGRSPINPALTGTKSVPALFSNRPDVRRLVHTPARGNPRGRRPAGTRRRDGDGS
ncbi:MAG: hypothetical protein E5Y50_25975 [Mesorhizobium sp.]|nr:MAG: hypothetical protein E5Y50_25975 [Mesorhizobium sp.]